MRAAFYQGARTFTTGEMATPTPGPQEARASIDAAAEGRVELTITN